MNAFPGLTFQDALAIDPGNALANRALAVFFMASKRWQEAEPFVKAAVASTGNGEAKMALADFYLRANRDDEAKTVLGELASAKSGFAEATTRLAEIDVRQGRTQQAYARLEQVLAQEPKSPRALTCGDGSGSRTRRPPRRLTTSRERSPATRP